ncbi:hypothetical protein [Gulosibacter sp. 10]|uniref:hypothetical protein n=1 Tax=Gulosibacter sp. 10 TaxID=1255570 RepID=UPI00097EB867|nr:hypothetical protein [Gulosibacter sp. 10]SJM61934.1 hypothetical protein FM112_08185 [Gulosibacter sp. 10]
MRRVTRLIAESATLNIGGIIASPEALGDGGGLVAVYPGDTVVIATGIHLGPVDLASEALHAAPTEVEPGWEDVFEFTAAVRNGERAVVFGPGDDIDQEYADLHEASVRLLRIRVSARGRDRAVDLAVDEPVEEYLVQAWPADGVEQPSALAAESAFARSRRESFSAAKEAGMRHGVRIGPGPVSIPGEGGVSGAAAANTASMPNAAASANLAARRRIARSGHGSEHD